MNESDKLELKKIREEADNVTTLPDILALYDELIDLLNIMITETDESIDDNT